MSKRVIKWSDARLFCNLVASTADTVVTWQVFDDSPAKDHTKARSLRGSLSDKKFRDRRHANEAGCGIYITANTCDDTGKRRAENVTGYTASFIDLDGAPLPDAPAVAFDIILETSPGKFHCWWLLQAGTDLALWSDTQARLAAFYGSDPVVHDASRVARCPGFWHLRIRPSLSWSGYSTRPPQSSSGANCQTLPQHIRQNTTRRVQQAATTRPTLNLPPGGTTTTTCSRRADTSPG